MAPKQVNLSDSHLLAWFLGRYDLRVHGLQKLSDEDVREIRRLLRAGFLQRVIAERFGVTQSQISNIKRGYRRSGVSSNG